MSEFKIIGCVSGYNEDDKRCNAHADFSFAGRSIYTGEDFSCTYCGDEWKDGLTAQERYERKHNVKHCDSCLSFQPPFAGDTCALCVSEADNVVDHTVCAECETPDCEEECEIYETDPYESDYDTSDYYGAESDLYDILY